MRRLSRWLGFGFWALILLFPKDSSTQPLYYKGKTIAVIEGRSPGGVGDLRTKAILPFLQKYIPGNPTVLPEYMPGGGGRQAANYVYRAKAEGLTIGASSLRAYSQAPYSASRVSNIILTSLSISGPLSARTIIFLPPEKLSV